MKTRRLRGLLAIPASVALLIAAVPSHAVSGCHVPPFHGAVSSAGAVATMNVVNTGRACRIDNYGVPATRGNPAEAGQVTTAPEHGTAAFDAPAVRYTPAPGYVGDDAFDYIANAKGNLDQRVTLKVHVDVHVTAP
ncbi:MAG: hypothetical protein JSR59_17590 [Proteobacteria bacterium]|nr:hypothetical protein [Pseudomonadota bacterium]